MINKTGRYEEIDFIKAYAIITVLILHSLPVFFKQKLYFPFYITQGVPLFMIIAGITSSLSFNNRSIHSFTQFFNKTNFFKYLNRIILPFSIILLFEYIILLFQGNISIKQALMMPLIGGFGPGSYFIPVFIQHILIFPFLYFLIEAHKKVNPIILLIGFFILSILLEYFCIFFNIPEWLYRLLIVRYIFAIALGIIFVQRGINLIYLVFGSIIGAIYIYFSSYQNYSSMFIYDSWKFQHAPAYLYTLGFLLIFWKIYPIFKYFSSIIKLLSHSTFHIFLFQMMYYAFFHNFVFNIIKRQQTLKFLIVPLDIFLCLVIGLIFFLTQKKLQLLFQKHINHNN